MPRFIEGQDRHQATLLPESLDEFIAEDNAVRVVDAFVDELDLQSLGFDGARPSETGRPGYHPGVLLKIYIYGYLNRIQSSRRLERECHRNVELMWLTRRLAPDFKTIADFRRENGTGVRNVCRRFVELCRELKLFSQAIVAIDGSKFKAVNARDKNFTPNKVRRRQEQIEESIKRYLDALETADRAQGSSEFSEKAEHLQDKLKTMREKMQRMKQIEKKLETEPDGQISMTDRDARSMATSGRGSGIVGYNVQTAVDTKHHLIVAHEVTNEGHDRSQLAPMAAAARDAMGTKKVLAIADRGYFNGLQIKACSDAGIDTILPKPMTSNAKAENRFDKSDFIYKARRDEYKCPAGERLIYRFTREERGLQVRRYWSSACPSCPMKAQCTPSDYRRVSRWEHEAVVDAAQRRLDKRPDAMKVRRRTVEHVFGTLKHWMGSTHFLTRTFANVRTEMNLHVLAYNLKRVISMPWHCRNDEGSSIDEGMKPFLTTLTPRRRLSERSTTVVHDRSTACELMSSSIRSFHTVSVVLRHASRPRADVRRAGQARRRSNILNRSHEDRFRAARRRERLERSESRHQRRASRRCLTNRWEYQSGHCRGQAGGLQALQSGPRGLRGQCPVLSSPRVGHPLRPFDD